VGADRSDQPIEPPPAAPKGEDARVDLNRTVAARHPASFVESINQELARNNSTAMRLICVRHGESPSNASTERLSLPDADGDRLTDRGRAQAQEVAEALAGCSASALISSPMRRATETAAVIAERTGLEPRVNPLIHELREFDGYADLHVDEQRSRRWSSRMTAHADDPSHAPDGAESFADVVGRVRRFKAELEGLGPEATVIAVSHGIFLRFFLLDSLLGDDFVPAHAERLWQLRTRNCGVSVFTRGERTRRLDPMAPGWACLSWMAPPGAFREPPSAGHRASAATAR
jgi:broad specificity phosphatase PhoE